MLFDGVISVCVSFLDPPDVPQTEAVRAEEAMCGPVIIDTHDDISHSLWKRAGFISDNCGEVNKEQVLELESDPVYQTILQAFGRTPSV